MKRPLRVCEFCKKRYTFPTRRITKFCSKQCRRRARIQSPEQQAQYRNQRKLLHPEKLRAYYRKWSCKRHGLTVADYDRMLVAQNGVCAICRRPDKNRALAIDHDHATKKVRGLLCSHCNMVIGKMRDDPMLLRVAADYLERRGT